MTHEPISDDPFYDPFTPQKALLKTPEGICVDSVETARNYAESMLPEISVASLRTDDKLLVDFDNNTKTEYLVTGLDTKSLVFGSDDVLNPNLDCKDEEGNLVTIIGSCILPSGNMLNPGAIMQGRYLYLANPQDGTMVSSGTVQDFLVKRKDETDGQYKEVSPNQLTQKSEISDEYNATQARFSLLTEQLITTGFNFDSRTEDVDGYSRYQTFLEKTDSALVYASRQGFGCAAIPQYQVYTYDAETSMLRAMRNIPGEGIFQMTVMHISPTDLAETGYRGSYWKNITMLEPSNLHRASHKTPIFTYTWKNPGQTLPTITIKTNAHDLDEQITVKSTSASQRDNEIPAEVNIEVDDNLSVHANVVNPQWWVDADSYTSVVSEETEVAAGTNHLYCKIGASKMVIPLRPDLEMGAMESVLRSVVNNRHRRFGSQVIRNRKKQD